MSGGQNYSSLCIFISTNTEEVAHSYASGNEAYAALAPVCSWSPDSIAILRNGKNITDKFTIRGREVSDVVAQDTSYGWCSAELEPKVSAANNESSMYTFEFYENGDVLEITSEPFRITK